MEWITLRLCFCKDVWRVGPVHDLIPLVIQNEIDLIGANCQDGVTFIVFVAHNSDQQCALRPTMLHQATTLFEHVVLAISFVIDWVGPPIDFAVMLKVAHRGHSVFT